MKKIFCVLFAISLLLSLTVSVEAKEPSLSTKPVHVLANDNNKYSAVIMADDSLWIWGRGRSSEDGHAVIVEEPVKVMDNVRSVSIAREYNTYAVITNDNVLWYVKYTDSTWNGRNWEQTRPRLKVADRGLGLAEEQILAEAVALDQAVMNPALIISIARTVLAYHGFIIKPLQAVLQILK